MRTLIHLDSEVLANPTSATRDFFAEVLSSLKGKSLERLWGFKKTSAATAFKEVERLDREIKQTLGVKGFALNLSGPASLTKALSACWDAGRPCLELLEFEEACGKIRNEAFNLAESLGAADQNSSLRFSSDEAIHLQAGLDFYYYLLPKMVMLASALRLASDAELRKRGIQAKEAVENRADQDDCLPGLFQNVRKVLLLANHQGSVKSTRAWAKYLTNASDNLKPVVEGGSYKRASDRLHKVSRALAGRFADRIRFVELETDLECIAKSISTLESLLPSLLLSLTLLELYWRPADRLVTAMTPVASPPVSESKPERRKGERAYRSGIDAPNSQWVPA